ncbi:MAG: hypothetical protein GY777_07590 [Candidatus Brocadiaceae bacterium]|nr:hypothetical protein [Candidatus Brocadiaceae bacterium]
MPIQYRYSDKEDAEKIVALLSEEGNRYNWSLGRWKHYYLDYPEGKPIEVIAVDNNRVIGHYGLLPVRINQFQAMLGVHAYISAPRRNLNIISNLLKLVDHTAQDCGANFVCAFANPEFTQIITRIFGWQNLGYVSFESANEIELELYQKRYRFCYSKDWYQWKLKTLKTNYIQNYQKDGVCYNQLLKTREIKKLTAKEVGHDQLHCWHPKGYSKEKPFGWSQPFSIKCFTQELPVGLKDIHNWYLEMGDNEAFELR